MDLVYKRKFYIFVKTFVKSAMEEKIRQLMKLEGLTQSRLAEILEINPAAVSHFLSGRNKPGFDVLQKLFQRFPRINPDWLLLDAPTMFRAEYSDSEHLSHSSPGVRAAGERRSLNLDAVVAGTTGIHQASMFEGLHEDSRAHVVDVSRSRDSQTVSGGLSGSTSTSVSGVSRPSEVSCIVVCYADGTFETFRPKVK